MGYSSKEAQKRGIKKVKQRIQIFMNNGDQSNIKKAKNRLEEMQKELGV